MGRRQRRRYRLDEGGNRIMGKDSKPLFDAVPTTGWGNPETLEHWREAWAAMLNARWIIDDEAAEVVRRIYRRCVEGKWIETTARMLQEYGILTPTQYWESKGIRKSVNQYKENGAAKAAPPGQTAP